MKPLTFKRAIRMLWQGRWRSVATAMVPIYLVTSLPPSAFAQTDVGSTNYPAAVLTPAHVHVNIQRATGSAYAGVRLPNQPKDQDIILCHAFAEPLIPVGAKTSGSENQALGLALKTFLARSNDEDVSGLTGFFASYPESAWRPSLDLNLAEVYYRTGNFSLALAAWQDAWDRTQSLGDEAGQKVANLAVAKLAKMKARIGRTDELVALFALIKGRNFSGQAAQLLVEARSGLWLMQKRPENAFRCGPSALQELSLATKHKVENDGAIKTSRSTSQGVALSDVAALSAKINMPLQMAKRSANVPFLFPAVIHWKLGHYAALVGMRDGKYEVHDTTFGSGQYMVSAETLDQETSGYFLVPLGKLAPGWTSVGTSEGSKVFGRGNTANNDPTQVGADAPKSDPKPNGDGGPGGDCGNSGSGSSSAGGDTAKSGSGDTDEPVDPDSQPAMTQSFVSAMLVSLNLEDNPVRYNPPVGPAMNFIVDYNQRDNTQPTTFTYGNLGPGWTYNYLSYLVPGSSTSTVYERGGGVETFFYNTTSSSWSPNQYTQAVLTQINSTTWQLQSPHGKIETYGQPDGSGRFFLTQVTDPLGNALKLAYDGNFRLVSLTDALGQVTTVAYESNTSTNLPAFYQIAKVTDPFGRSAQFAYYASGQLQQITDIIGITSHFTYLANGFITSLTTPYGVTTFAYGDVTTDQSLGTTRWMTVTYPDGNTTRTEYNETQNPSGSTSGADNAGVPAGMYPGLSVYNNYEQYRNTYFWDKEAYKDHPGDYTQAKVLHWLHTSDINTTSDIEESHKFVDQNRIWFAYGDGNAGQISSIQASDTMIALPTEKGRILDDGSTQLYQYQYNAIGNVTQQIDPIGRETDYAYATNNIDLLTVRQKNGAGSDLLTTYTYNSQHEVLTVTDASGQTTTNSDHPNGELHTVTNAKSQVTTFAYNSSNYLTSVTGPVAGATTSFSYDGYGRIQKVTNSQGFITTTNYDAMDRPTLVTYPDGTTSQMSYSRLDLQFSRDRLGRWSQYFYNALRQNIAVMDPLGHVTTMNYSLSAGLSSLVDPAGHATTWVHDNQNRVVRKIYPDSTSQQIAYENTTSRVKSVTDAKGQIATNTYVEQQVTVNGATFNTSDNNVQQVVYTNATIATPSVSYTYDQVYPRVLTMTDGTGQTAYAYNPVTAAVGSGRLASVTTPLTTVSYTISGGAPAYDQLGRSLGQIVGGVPSSMTYDTLGRVATASNALTGTGASFSYSYLKNTGRVSSVTNPNGQSTAYTYQDSTATPNEPRLSEIKNLTSTAAIISKFDYGYDSQGQITSWTQQSGTNNPQNYGLQYDNAGRLINATVTDTTTSALLHQYAYSYDAVGNRTAEQIDGSVTTASFNNLNQLTGTSAGGKMVFSGNVSKYSTVTVAGGAASLDANNNFRGTASVSTGTNNVPIIAQDVDGNVATNTYQVVVPPGTGTTSTYDLNGNLLSDSTRTYGWDAKNELVSIVYNSGFNAGNHTEFTYNGAGARVKIAERTGTAIGSGSITSTKQYSANEEFDGSGNVTKRYFAQGEQRVVSGVTTNYFYTRDHLGSIREMIDSSGNIQARYSYDPYGRATKVSGSLDCDFQYAGMYEHAASGLNLTIYRAYNPNIGSWLSRDPSGESAGIDLYAYCSDSPVCNVDRLGEAGIGFWRNLLQLIIVGFALQGDLLKQQEDAEKDNGTPPEQTELKPGPGVSTPDDPDPPETPKPEQQSGQGGDCNMDKPPGPTPVTPPVPIISPAARNATEAAKAEAEEEAEFYASEAEFLGGAAEVDEAIIVIGVVVK